MSIQVVRTTDGWWVESGTGRLHRVDTDAGTTAALLADRSAVQEAAARATADPDAGRPVAEAQLLSPVTTPCRVVAQMVNYRSHAVDSGFDPDTVPPAFFRKASGSVSGPRQDIVRPPHVRFLDYEVELGLVMGADLPVGTEVTDSTLPHHVAALVVADDVSARDLQLPKTQFYESKSYPTFTPLGPRLLLVAADELARLPDLRLTLRVNGATRQDRTAVDMIVRPARALTLLARFQALAPGDVLLTGTPGGTALKSPGKLLTTLAALLPPHKRWQRFFARQQANPDYLKDGDVVTARISTDDGVLDLGEQRTVVRAR
ncbi:MULTISPECIES: fumarylacetoacetate hydrolase family protein [Streptomyces]|uniref:Fumarylacetoacetate hydrolase family protein n=2 Tax=Streptomyces TaxID=1883 RepID=A0A3R7HD31_9ACTN|nr:MULTISPECIES: fumarylacetoacetate hydrolase family protein [Streptomyces]KNE83678.1 fumarylacetoacetase [Streptomyces fradiae]OFA51104.1 fumarylacetoacetase [Streptomyces fradiae]PQM20284.1 fumarylacetoacetase [Streptomyces xinghaiensis]RKM93945.1 fumarylacetoacetate hydrolase family protein [Streptomyces xinghaiensis]RNC69448.1 fumarylacetoacetate hydrolase family protein [Streptomyces xinghaiensis]